MITGEIYLLNFLQKKLSISIGLGNIRGKGSPIIINGQVVDASLVFLNFFCIFSL